METLTEIFRINETNLTRRKGFMRLTQADINVLAKLQPWSEKVSGEIARHFYDHQFSFPETVGFFQTYLEKRGDGRDLTLLRQHLEEKQAAFFRRIFNEANKEQGFGVEYFERALRIGKLHNVINLPLKWYVGSYPVYFDLVRQQLKQHFWWRPFFRARAEQAIFTVFNYDIQAITEAFFYDYLQSVGMSLESVDVKHQNEDLSDYYAELKSYVSDVIIQTTMTSRQLAEAGEQFALASEQTGEAIRQIVTTMHHVAGGANRQTELAGDTVQTAQQLHDSSKNIARGAQEQAQAVHETSLLIIDMAQVVEQVESAIEEATQTTDKVNLEAADGAAVVAQMSQGMQVIRLQVDETAEKVRQMGVYSREISQIVEAINTIADKTDMLALNAAVEAARAGEHGRGFAVVADHVRKLSEDAKNFTTNIAGLIENVQHNIQDVVAAMEVTVSQVADGAQSAAETNSSLARIQESVKDVTRVNVEIITAATRLKQHSQGVVTAMDAVGAVVEENTAVADSMAVSSSEMTKMIEAVTSLAEQHSAAAEEVSASTEQISAQAQQMIASSQELKHLADELQNVVAKFRIEE